MHRAATAVHSACSAEWLAVRDGRHRWGDSSAVVGRYGVVVHTVVVYPPGSSTVDRRWIRAWRSAPLFSVVLFWVSLAVFASAVPMGWAFAAAIGAVVAMVAALARRTRDLRRSVVQLMTEVSPGSAADGAAVRQAAVHRLVATMNATEVQLAAGRIDELEFQRRWHTAYDAVRSAGFRRRAQPADA
ncbi:hypothetical protein ATC03_16830 [Agromyces aureus]|uniref:Uncharacterized protein n=2 Tax=Agromyces aureus TaxID=453304 RepID=A0A191WIX5_9MICO|nr:hypothetical protein ATC03_16830 [Agromyces aureus]